MNSGGGVTVFPTFFMLKNEVYTEGVHYCWLLINLSFVV